MNFFSNPNCMNESSSSSRMMNDHSFHGDVRRIKREESGGEKEGERKKEKRKERMNSRKSVRWSAVPDAP